MIKATMVGVLVVGLGGCVAERTRCEDVVVTAPVAALPGHEVVAMPGQRGTITVNGDAEVLTAPDRFVITVSDGGKRAFLPARPGLQSLPGLIIFRYDADLFYANANRFSDDVQGLLRSAPTPVNWLVLDCAAIGDVDSPEIPDDLRFAFGEAAAILVLIFAPMMPHLAEECWTDLGGSGLIANADWPKADPSLVVEATVTLPIQINGKKRGEIDVPTEADAAAVETLVRADAKVNALLEGKPIRKIIVVPKRIVNIVV